MNSYKGKHAKLYDIFYKDKPYVDESVFVKQCLDDYGIEDTHRLLELACGTGSHAFILEKFGYEIVATDYSDDMLTVARSKAIQSSSKVDFRLQDMRMLDLNDRPFDAVICLFNSIGYITTNGELHQVFQGVYRHLRPNGLFIFQFWHAGAFLRSYDPVRVRRWSTPQGELVRISETSLDCAKQISNVSYTIYELRKDGTYSKLIETQVNRYFLIQEMENMLTRCNFIPLKWFSGFSKDENITQDTWHIVAVARRQ